jgi:hypothetical protein
MRIYLKAMKQLFKTLENDCLPAHIKEARHIATIGRINLLDATLRTFDASHTKLVFVWHPVLLLALFKPKFSLAALRLQGENAAEIVGQFQDLGQEESPEENGLRPQLI